MKKSVLDEIHEQDIFKYCLNVPPLTREESLKLLEVTCKALIARGLLKGDPKQIALDIYNSRQNKENK